MHAWLVLRNLDLTQFSSLNTWIGKLIYSPHTNVLSIFISARIRKDAALFVLLSALCSAQSLLTCHKPNQTRSALFQGVSIHFWNLVIVISNLCETKNNICSTMIINMTMVTGPVSGVTWAVVSFRTPWLVTQFPPLIVSPARMRTARHHVFLVSWQKLFQVAMIIFMFLSDQHYESCFILDKKSDWRSGWYFSHLSKSWNRQNSGSNSSSCHGRQLWGQHE